MFGALHDGVVIVDMAQQADDAKNVGIIDRIEDGLGFAAGAHDIGPSKPREMLGKSGLAERGNDTFQFGDGPFAPVSKLIE